MNGAWTAAGVAYHWTLKPETAGRRWEGIARASEGARQTVRVEPPEGEDAGAVGPPNGAGAHATLEITVRGMDEMSGRAATVHLVWDTAADRYRVAGLVH